MLNLTNMDKVLEIKPDRPLEQAGAMMEQIDHQAKTRGRRRAALLSLDLSHGLDRRLHCRRIGRCEVCPLARIAQSG